MINNLQCIKTGTWCIKLNCFITGVENMGKVCFIKYIFSTFQDSNYLQIKRKVSMSIEKMKETSYQKIDSV